MRKQRRRRVRPPTADEGHRHRDRYFHSTEKAFEICRRANACLIGVGERKKIRFSIGFGHRAQIRAQIRVRACITTERLKSNWIGARVRVRVRALRSSLQPKSREAR